VTERIKVLVKDEASASAAYVEKRAPTLGIAGALQGRVKSEIRFVERETSADSKTKHLNHELRPPYCGVLPACKELLLPTALNAADKPLAIVINLNEGAVALGALIAGSIVTSRRMDAFTRAQ